MAEGMFDTRKTNATIKGMYDAFKVGGWVGAGFWARGARGRGTMLLGGGGRGPSSLRVPCAHPRPPSPPPLSQGKRRSELVDTVLAIFPPRFHVWLLAKFTEPAAWLNARLAFTRTAAVSGGVWGCGWLGGWVRGWVGGLR